jgi:type I restriction enzyme S subunit
MEKLKKMPFPIPPIEEQERIVGILDKFEALVNDLTQGLPAEIEARREQYEYYRNKLLTFKVLA